MSQIIDPSYNARMNNEKEKFGIVFHVPELPSPSSAYANTVAFLSTDGCFYECHIDGDNYVWEKQTFGPKRQFIISVTWIVPGADGYSFNDEVNTIKQIVTEMKKYDSYFVDLENEFPTLSSGTMNLIEACSITDKLIDYVNKYCDAGFTHVEIDTDSPSSSEYVDPPAATCEMLATYINEVVGVLNPHAGFSVLTKEVEALRQAISGISPTYTAIDFLELRDTIFPLAGDDEVVLNKKYYVYNSTFQGSQLVHMLNPRTYATAEEASSVNPLTLRVYNGTPLYIKNASTGEYTIADGSSMNPVISLIQYYTKSEDVSVVTPADFNLLRNTFNQFTSDQNVANGKFKTAISALSTAVARINTSIGATGLKGDIDKIIGTYLGINTSEWTSETKSLVTRINALNSSITDASLDGSIAKSVKSISDIVSGQDGRSGLVATVAALHQAVNATGTGLKAVVGDSNGGLVKAVNELATKVEGLEKTSGTSKIQSIDDRLELARDAFAEMATMLESVPKAYAATEDSSPVSGKRYWTRSVEYVDVVNPNLSDGNDYFIRENGIYTQIDSSYHVTPGVDLHCSKAIYKYHAAKDVQTTGFERGIVYYESNLSQDTLADAVWTIIEKSADVAAALEDDEEPENQGD